MVSLVTNVYTLYFRNDRAAKFLYDPAGTVLCMPLITIINEEITAVVMNFLFETFKNYCLVLVG